MSTRPVDVIRVVVEVAGAEEVPEVGMDPIVELTGDCGVNEPGRVCGPVWARGMCGAHYARWRKYGDPLVREQLNGLSLEERFRRQTEQVGDCRLWVGARQTTGYGQTKGGDGGRQQAHRVAWELAYGPIPVGLFVLHRCPAHRRDCVAVEHLYLGDHAQNMRDMVDDGTAARGESNGSAKLTEADIRAIRSDPRNNSEVGRAYGVHRTTVSRIRSRKKWGHVA